jgi:hypothetical protein
MDEKEVTMFLSFKVANRWLEVVWVFPNYLWLDYLPVDNNDERITMHFIAKISQFLFRNMSKNLKYSTLIMFKITILQIFVIFTLYLT